MQEEKSVNAATRIYEGMFRIVAWVFLFASWLGLGVAISCFFRAAQSYGILDIRAYLDAGLGYYGLFSFGLAALATIAAVKGGISIQHGILRLFKLTFFLSIFFVMPTLFSLIVALLANFKAS